MKESMRLKESYSVGRFSSMISDWCTSAKTTVNNFLSEPETPIFLQLLEDPNFREVQNWCDGIREELRKTKETSVRMPVLFQARPSIY